MQNQYDDDLTLGCEEYDDSYYTGTDDLFEVSMDDESPISRLKSLILSIDWEITDEVLLSFNAELESLKNTWAGDKINLVYVQALEKVSNYIYSKKADAHLGAIKLLLTLYHNLEKIVTNPDWSNKEKKALLFEDVKRFEQLKRHIAKGSQETQEQMEDFENKNSPLVEAAPYSSDDGSELKNLRAAVLGLDWEVTDQELDALQREVTALAQKYSGNKPCIILLKGLRTLGLYIQQTKPDANGEAFKMLRVFSDSLEKLVSYDWTPEEEKEILISAVEKFNGFKTLLKTGTQVTPQESVEEEQSIRSAETEAIEVDTPVEDKNSCETEKDGGFKTTTPAFSDMAEDDVQGFQAEEEAARLGLDGDVDSRVAGLFPDETDAEEGEQLVPVFNTPREIALQGVDVETEADDDSCEERLPEVDGVLAPALSAEFEEDGFGVETVGAEDEAGVEAAVSSFFGEIGIDNAEGLQNAAEPVAALFGVEPPEEVSLVDETVTEKSDDVFVGTDEHVKEVESALQGVDVETEADDDSGEAPLAFDGDKLAPALSEFADEAKDQDFDSVAEESEEEIFATVEDFFDGNEGDVVDAVEPDAEKTVADTEGKLTIESEPEGGASGVDDGVNEDVETEVDFTPVSSNESIGFEDDVKTEGGSGYEFGVGKGPAQTLAEAKPETEGNDFAAADEVKTEVDQAEIDFSPGMMVEDPVDVDKPGFERSEMVDSALTSALAGVENEIESVNSEVEGDETTGVDLAPALADVEFSEETSVGFEERDSDSKELVDLEDRLDDYFSTDAAEPVEDVEEFVVFEPVVDVAAGMEIVQNIRRYVDELAAGGDEMLLQELLSERDSLREVWKDKPVESTFLLLFTNVSDFVEKYHGDAVVNALALLQELGQSLARLASLDENEKQYALLEDVRKVLSWQEGLVVI